jgi:hypothetical protein
MEPAATVSMMGLQVLLFDFLFIFWNITWNKMNNDFLLFFISYTVVTFL